MPIRVDVCEGNRIRYARNCQKCSRPKRTATGIQKYADIVQGWIGDNYVRFTVAIQIADGDLVVLAITKTTTTQQENSTEEISSMGTHIHLLWLVT
jgi:hypothetical protein